MKADLTAYIHERADGVKVEYRRGPSASCVLVLEARELRPSGRPYDARWYPVSDGHFLDLQAAGSDIVELLGGGEF